MKKIFLTALLFIGVAFSITSYAADTGKSAVMMISNDKTVILGADGYNADGGGTDSGKGINDAADTSDSENSTAGNSPQLIDSFGLDINRVNVPETATVLVTLSGEKNADKGILNVYQRTAGNADTLSDSTASGDTASTENTADTAGGAVLAEAGTGAWELKLSASAIYGKNGLYKEVEGDCKTPVGIFRMNTPFGIAGRLEGFPENYLQVNNGHYWNGDSDSPLYNKMVNTADYTDFNREKSEHIVAYGAYYNYCIDTGYNPEGTPHKGSAIYLHCDVDHTNTHGCIAIPEADMIEVMKLYDEGNTYIAVYDRADTEAMYR